MGEHEEERRDALRVRPALHHHRRRLLRDGRPAVCRQQHHLREAKAYGPGRVGQETHRARRAADRGGEAVQSKAKVRLYGRRGKEVDGSLLIRWYSKAAHKKTIEYIPANFSIHTTQTS